MHPLIQQLETERELVGHRTKLGVMNRQRQELEDSTDFRSVRREFSAEFGLEVNEICMQNKYRSNHIHVSMQSNT